ncbi:N-acetylmuramoyl-L-alanine amidase family protein [Desnuesiella massiliensis]|uniref:N-acetylmuramoyl-L-alanine amidase family protein n=1 Tax=Desnuesiella massiliensis TaxID=1650662 RepID=UPI0006E3B076|nr:N-acetylmuramoyl-L-alanine amidase [Desnuesiella massiliensis]
MKRREIFLRNRKKRMLRKMTSKVILFLIIIVLFVFTSYQQHKKNKLVTSNKNIENVSNSNKQQIDSESNFTVCIDAGHGGYDKGTTSLSGIHEKDVTLEIALKLGKLLEKNNIKVIYTRNSDKVSWPSNEKEDLRERVKISNDAKADVFISIHGNGNTNTSFKGMETWCRFPNTEGEKLAKAIQKELSDYNYTSSRGIKYEAEKSLAVLRLNKSVSTLVELGFLTNSSDEKFITSESGQTKCAEALAKGILNYKASYKS